MKRPLHSKKLFFDSRKTSIFKKFRNRIALSNEAGFSLIEIMLVFAIIAVLSSISMPAMRGFAASRRLKTSAQAIADTFAFARDMAITERNTHLVVFDVGNNRYWLASSETFDVQNPVASAGRAANTATTANGQAVISRTSGIMGIPRPLSQGITIAAVVTTRNGVTQQLTSGVDYVYFSPTSTSVDTSLYLQNVRGNVTAIVVEATTGRASIREMSPEEIQTLNLGNDL
ncbi:MAG: prepilin-type N-terminal cleavage/methylation domain-containing protein [Candidatus Poribacteria bacterium]|nr:prepilin-type N-terminal cleavage/methylation domain-containing protein [Candidatus Poribacteria bacterium]